MQEFIVVYVTAGSADEADRMARSLVDGQCGLCQSHQVGAVGLSMAGQSRAERRRAADYQNEPGPVRGSGETRSRTPQLLSSRSDRVAGDRRQRRLSEMAQGAGYFRPRPRGDGIRTVREVSAGGVMYRKHSDEIQIALIHVRNRWGLHKGHVEEGERIEETALREVREETGLEGRVVKKTRRYTLRLS